MSTRLRSLGRRFGVWLRRNFVAGVIVLMPLVATIVVLQWLFNAIDGIMDALVEFIIGEPVTGVGFGIIVGLVFIAGIFAANFLGKRFIRYGESFIFRVPIVGEIYGMFRRVTDSVTLSQQMAFKEVVFVDFPRTGMKTIGFVTNRIKDTSGQELLALYVPTVPNPTSGFIQIVPPDRVSRANMSVEEAMRTILSAGIVIPEVVDLGGTTQDA
ncbi:MAG: DUF502 domain-containing protein [Chloroflexota bacterium]